MSGAVRLGTVALVAGALAVVPVPAQAANDTTTARLGHRALLADDGAVLVRVQVRCPAGAGVLEAHVTLSQGTASGQGGIPGVGCDGRPSWHTARVAPTEGTFAPGSARASSFVLVLLDGGSSTDDGQDTADLRVSRAGGAD